MGSPAVRNENQTQFGSVLRKKSIDFGNDDFARSAVLPIKAARRVGSEQTRHSCTCERVTGHQPAPLVEVDR